MMQPTRSQHEIPLVESCGSRLDITNQTWRFRMQPKRASRSSRLSQEVSAERSSAISARKERVDSSFPSSEATRDRSLQRLGSPLICVPKVQVGVLGN
ncbi:MAG: hypothetical protein JWM63_3869 [Gammaproteobacteria bacterium]|nr:hypothetical protein [Gammaproteobacteria bacterium]